MKDVTLAAYYYPGFHQHPKFDQRKYPGFTEWDLIRTAKPRFAGHEQPRTPLWGHENESDPVAMEKKIAAAADHGVDVFIFDWFFHDAGAFLEGALDRGFLNSRNNSRMKFCLMWANHDWYDIQGYNPANGAPNLFFPGKVTPATWEAITELVVERYFQKDNYWKIDGKPYFSIYEMGAFLDSFGSVDAARAALDGFQTKARAAGYPGVHINAVLWGEPNLPGGKTPADWPKLCIDLAIDSLTGYTWVHHGALNYETFPVSQYVEGRETYLRFLEKAQKTLPAPYFPNVTIGWDNSPRAHPDADWTKPGDHVVNPVLLGNTPKAFGEAVAEIRDRLLNSATEPKVMTINAWNEWPEGSMLEPDIKYGYGYLEALRKAVGGDSILQIVVTEALPEDASDIVRIRKDGWIAAYPNADFGITVEDILPKDFDSPERIALRAERIRSRPGSPTWVARVNGETVGFCIASEGEIENHLGALYVMSSHRRLGVGRRLMDTALSRLGRGKDISLEVVSYNQNAIAFYESFGFVRETEPPALKPSFPSGKELPWTAMRLASKGTT